MQHHQPDAPLPRNGAVAGALSAIDLDRAARDVAERLAAPPLAFDAAFENGSLDRVVRLGPDWYHIELRPDTWYRFHFRVRGCRGREVCFEFTCRNISNASCDEGKGRWTKSGGLVKPLVSDNRRDWKPVAFFEKHQQDPGKYRFVHRFTADEAYLCHHQPYTYGDLLEWLKTLRDHPLVRCEALGKTRNGFVQPVLTVADHPSGTDLVVLIGREDADENVGSWGVEGLVRALLDADALRPLLKRYTFKIVPMVGIDGVVAGAHHSAGYSYGGSRWHLEPAPAEIENVKRGIRHWVAAGQTLRLAGKVHAPQCFTADIGYDGILTASARLKKTVEAGVAHYSQGRYVASPRRDPAIRPKGYFERFVFDAFELYEVFGTHVHGDSPDSARRAGAALMHGLGVWLGQARK